MADDPTLYDDAASSILARRAVKQAASALGAAPPPAGVPPPAQPDAPLPTFVSADAAVPSDPYADAAAHVLQERRRVADARASTARFRAQNPTMDPARAGEVLRLAAAAQADPQLVSDRLDEYRNRVAAQNVDWGRVAVEHPEIVEYMKDSVRAPLVKDEVASYGTLHWLIAAPAHAFWDAANEQRTIARQNRELAGLGGEDNRQAIERLEAKYGNRDYGEADASVPWLAHAYTGIAKMAPYIGMDLAVRVGGAALGGLFGTPAGAVAGTAAGPEATPAGAAAGASGGKVLGSFLASAAFNAYETAGPLYWQISHVKNADGSTIDPSVARAFALGGGIVSGALLAGPGKYFAKAIPGGEELLQKVGAITVSKALASSTATRAAVTLLKSHGEGVLHGAAVMAAQGALSAASVEAAKAWSGPSFHASWQPIVDAAGSNFVRGLQDMTFLAAYRPGRAFLRDLGAARASADATARIAVLTDTAEGLRLLQEAPEEFRALVEKFKSENGALSELWVDKAAWDKHWQDRGLDPREVSSTVNRDGGAAYDEASRVEGDAGRLRVPVEGWLSGLANDHGRELLDHVALGQDPLESRTPAQRRELAAEIARRVEREAQVDREAMDDGTGRVYDDWYAKQRAAGADHAEADANARNLAAQMKVFADAINGAAGPGEDQVVTPYDVYSGDFRVEILSPEQRAVRDALRASEAERRAASAGAGAEVPAPEEGGPAQALEQSAYRPTTTETGEPIHPTRAGVEAFWRWARDTKAVDSEGRPLLLLHGTHADASFEEARPPFWLTEDPDIAEHYAGANETQIYPVYARVERPLEARDAEDVRRVLRAQGWSEDRLERAAESLGANAGESWAWITDVPGVVDALKAAGYDGAHVHDDVVFNDYAGDSPIDFGDRDHLQHSSWVVFDANQVKAAYGNEGGFSGEDGRLFASGPSSDPRGEIVFHAPEAPGEPVRVDIFRNAHADKSTMAHETQHFVLAVLSRIASRADAPPELKAQYERLLEWMGYGGHEQRERELAELGDKATTEARRREIAGKEEKLTYAWEAYLLEGKAPTPQLRGVFARFTDWLARIYKDVRGIEDRYRELYGRELELNDDVRAIFDRLLASKEEIDAARRAVEAQPFAGIDEVLTPEERERRAALGEEERSEAELDLARTIADDQAREQEKFFRARKDAITDEVEAEVAKNPVFRALEFLQTGRLRVGAGGDVVEGADLPPGLWDGGKHVKIDFQAARLRWGLDFARVLARKGLTAAKGGGDPDAIAQALGWPDGDALVRALAESADRRAVVVSEVQSRLAEQFGPSLLERPDDMRRAAVEALHNDAAARRILLDIVGLRRLAGRRAADARDKRVAVLEDAAKRVAAQPQEIADVEPGRLTPRLLDEAAQQREAIARKAVDPEVEANALAAAAVLRAKAAMLRDGREVTPERVAAAARRDLARRAADFSAERELGIDLGAVERMAREQVERKTYRDLSPNYYRVARTSAARRANELAEAGRFGEARVEKERELLNLYLFREATKARKEMERGRALCEEAATSARIDALLTKAGGDYADVLHGLLEGFEFRKGVSGTEIDRRRRLNEWIAGERAAGREPILPEPLLDKLQRDTSWRDLTVSEMRDLGASVANVIHLAKTKDLLRVAGNERRLDEWRAALVARLRATFPGAETPTVSKITKEATSREKRRIAARLKGAVVRPEELLRELDGGERGPWSELFQALADADNEHANLMYDVTKPIMEMIDSLPVADKVRLRTQEFTVRSIGQTLTLENALVVALNWGTRSNRDKLLRGWSDVERFGLQSWTPAVVEEILGHLTANDWRLVEQIWESLESLWPQAEALERRLTGVVPEKLDRLPFDVVTADGETLHMKGGYYPMVYDRRFSKAGARQAEQIAAGKFALYDADYDRAVTPQGYLQRRVEEFARPVDLQLDGLTRHLAQATKDITHREAALSVYRLLTDEAVVHALTQHAGEHAVTILQTWLRDAINDCVVRDGGAAKLLGYVESGRTGFTGAIFAFNLAQALQNLANVANASEKVGLGTVRRGYWEFMHDREAALEFVMSKSIEMRNRRHKLERDVAARIKRLFGKTGTMADIERKGYQMMEITDLLVSMPMWLGSYRTTLDRLRAENDALPEASRREEAALDREAVCQADSDVRLALSSGATKDLPPLLRDPRSRWFTMFNGFGNSQLNRWFAAGSDAARMRREGRPAAAVGRIMRTFFWMAAAKVFSEMLTGRGPDKDEEGKRRWLRWLLLKSAQTPLEGVPVVTAVTRAIESGRDVSLTPSVRVYQAAKDSATANWTLAATGTRQFLGYGDEVTAAQLQAAFLSNAALVGYAKGLPVAQVQATGRYVSALASGAEQPAPGIAAVPDVALGLAYGPRRDGIRESLKDEMGGQDQ